MGDRVAVLKDGVLQQCAAPRELYNRPANVFVAGFMGSPSMNLFTLPVTDGGVRFGPTVVPVPRNTLGLVHDSEVIVGVRPEHLEIAGDGLEIEVDVVEELGSDAYIYGRSTAADLGGQIVARADWRRPPPKGARVRLHVDPGEVHLFSPTTGRRLG